MSLSGLLDIGKSALLASQTALSVTSHNIANVNTPGFNRQEAILNIASPVAVQGGLMGMGVMVTGIKRNYDNFIQGQLLLQQQNHGRTSAQSQVLSQVEQIFNEVKDLGLQTSLQDFFNAWNDVAVNPEGYTQRNVLIQKANSLVSSAKSMERSILATLKNTNTEINDIVDRINSTASDIAMLNDKIVQAEAGVNSGTANDLRDQRDNLLNQLGDLTGITYYEDKNGAVNVMMGMRSLVSATKTNTLFSQMNSDGNNEIYLDGIHITSNVNKGQLGGLIAARDNIASGPLMDLRRLIASVTKEVNLLHLSGFGLDGSTNNNFFNTLQLSTEDASAGAAIPSSSITDLSQLTLDEYDITFDASSNYYVKDKQTGATVTSGTYDPTGTTIAFDGIEVDISGTVTSSDSFSISPLTDAIRNFGVSITDTDKIAASSFGTELHGNNANALQLSKLSDTTIANLSGSSFSGYYQRLVSDVGVMSRRASDSLKFDDTMLNEIQNRRESVSGVSLDEEAANLIRFQRSFEAGAKMLQVTDELLQTILNL